MNRKQKIIVSITGITIVALALLGITYAYYLTRIQGNTNTNSISITTADLKLEYDDNNSYIDMTNIMPGTSASKTFTVSNPGTNDLNEYAVGIDEVTNTLTRTQDLTYTITCQEKLISAADTAYTACSTTSTKSGTYPKTNSQILTNSIKAKYIQKYTITITYANPDEDQSIDMGSTIKGRMQIYSTADTIELTGSVASYTTGDFVQINSEPKTSQLIYNEETEKYEYKLIGVPIGEHTISIRNINTDGEITIKGTTELKIQTGTSSNIDITNKTITFTETERVAKVNITSVSTTLEVDMNEISDGKIYLNKEIIANAKLNKEGRTIYSEEPLTTPLVETSLETEMTLSTTLDKYGISYYFRGNVKDNYVEFADMCWRIVRIEGDGSTKLILSKQDHCNSLNDNDSVSSFIDTTQITFGFEENNNVYSANASTLNQKIYEWYNKVFTTNNEDNEYGKKLKSDSWCIGKNSNYKYNSKGELLEINDTSNSWKYTSGLRLDINKEPSLLCENEETFESKIGQLTMDEVFLAGGGTTSNTYYLRDNAESVYWTYTITKRSFHSGAEGYCDIVVNIRKDGRVFESNWFDSDSIGYVRAVVTLTKEATISSGDGTQSNPYVIE